MLLHTLAVRMTELLSGALYVHALVTVIHVIYVSRENEFSFVDGAIKNTANRLHKMRVST